MRISFAGESVAERLPSEMLCRGRAIGVGFGLGWRKCAVHGGVRLSENYGSENTIHITNGNNRGFRNTYRYKLNRYKKIHSKLHYQIWRTLLLLEIV